MKICRNLISDKEDLLSPDKKQDHCMKLLQKQTVWNSFDSEKVKPRNKLKRDQLSKPFGLEEI